MLTKVAAIGAGLILLLGLGACGSPSEEESPAANSVPDGFFGVVPQVGLGDDDIARMAQGNIGTIRLVVPWGQVDPSINPEDLNFSSVDPIVLSAAKEGIRILPTVYGSPEWAARDIDGADCSDPISCAAFAPRSEQAISAWKAFLVQMVQRYGPDGKIWDENPDLDPVPIHTWQIWNEQNSPTFYQPKIDPIAYEKLVAASSDAIKGVDDKAQVILGGMFGTPPPGQTAWSFLRAMYSVDGAKDAFDAVGVHPYAAHESKLEYQVRRIHSVIERARDDAALWITEVGASSEEGSDPLQRGPQGQAETLREAFSFFLAERRALHIDGVTWYSWRDVPGPAPAGSCVWCPGSGLFEYQTLTPKPAWKAFVSFSGGS